VVKVIKRIIARYISMKDLIGSVFFEVQVV